MKPDLDRRDFMKIAAGATLGSLSLGHAAIAQNAAPAAAPGSEIAPAPAVKRPGGQLNREVRVATVSLDSLEGGRTPEGYMAACLRRMDLAATGQPDIICLPEGFGRTREAIPGPFSAQMGAWAQAHGCYLIAPYGVLVGERRYNSSVLFDRQGNVVGHYNKAHPTEGETRRITPGDLDPPVFKTDFGVIGMQICFDANWPETWRRLKENGAEVVFFSSAYPATMHCAAFARANEYYVVSSARTRPSRVFDITGDIIATTGAPEYWVDATIHLGKRLFDFDGNEEKMPELQKKYGPRVRVTWHSDDHEFALASLDPALAIEDVIREFGLAPLREYVANSEKMQNAVRE